MMMDLLSMQGWTIDDLAENRLGRLSAAQKTKLEQGTPELFGLLRTGLPKEDIRRGVVDTYDGECREFEGPTSNGPTLTLTVGTRILYWLDAESYRASTILAARMAILAGWARDRQHVRVYALGNKIVAIEPLPLEALER
ncbi:hypothetical protein BH09MYX1_BH09MYX1_03060 [soil metagenome]